ncbi:hypothetical protein BSKO_06009 [Bryopsis sp. KO-2023]|nr:hypothetical protein BSKO_06009 [Bryopsis sp. KO-2023]
MRSRRRDRKAAESAKQLSIDIVCAGSSDDEGFTGPSQNTRQRDKRKSKRGVKKEASVKPRRSKRLSASSGRNRNGDAEESRVNQLHKPMPTSANVDQEVSRRLQGEAVAEEQPRWRVRKSEAVVAAPPTSKAMLQNPIERSHPRGGVSTPFAPVANLPPIPPTITTPKTASTIDSDILAALDSIERKHRRRSSSVKPPPASRDRAEGFRNVSESPCDSEFFRRLDEVERAHVMMPQPGGVETTKAVNSTLPVTNAPDARKMSFSPCDSEMLRLLDSIERRGIGQEGCTGSVFPHKTDLTCELSLRGIAPASSSAAEACGNEPSRERQGNIAAQVLAEVMNSPATDSKGREEAVDGERAHERVSDASKRGRSSTPALQQPFDCSETSHSKRIRLSKGTEGSAKGNPMSSPIQGVINVVTPPVQRITPPGTETFEANCAASTPDSAFLASLDKHMAMAEALIGPPNPQKSDPAISPPSPKQLQNAGGLPPREVNSRGVLMGGPSEQAMTAREDVPFVFERVVAATDEPDEQVDGWNKKELSAYLPEECCHAFANAGVPMKLYDWQAECLCRPGVLQGKNLVYCAPTSAGKSLISDTLMLRHIIHQGRVCLVVLPFISLCREKARHLEKLLEPTGKIVRNHFGVEGSREIFRPDTGVLVCTIEKANLLVSRMVEEESLNRLGMVVVDELHMVGDENRGYLLELLLTKLRYATMVNVESSGFQTHEGLQIIGMSATMPNGEAVARWLGAELYTTNFRPVPLVEYFKVGRQIKDENMKVVRELAANKQWEARDPDHVALLTKETIDGGHSVLIFCGTKRGCEVCVKQLAELLEIPERFIGGMEDRRNRASIVEELSRIPGGATSGLSEVVSKGLAFHHSGLSSDDRELVETAFRCGAVSVLAATSTVAAGVNLPARRVIFRDPYVGLPTNLLDATRYRQMSGRAGRAGIDTIGESVLIATNRVSAAKVANIMRSSMVPIVSCLSDQKRGMKRAVLEVVASGAVRSPEDVHRYIKSTLLAATSDFQAVVASATTSSLKWLSLNLFIRWDEQASIWLPTPLGKASFASSMSPTDALTVKRDLETARSGLVLATDLHLTYLISPVGEDMVIDWQKYFEVYSHLKGLEEKVAKLVGVDYSIMQALSMGQDYRSAPLGSTIWEQIRVAKRFYGALVLHEIIQEVHIDQITERYRIGRGNVYALQERSGRFASMVAAFCERMGWLDLESLVAKFQGRIWRGVRQEILILTEIPYVKAHRARILYKAGLRTVEAVAAVESVDRLAGILAKGSFRAGDNPAAQFAMERVAAKKILRGAQYLLIQKAQELQEQANQATAVVSAIPQAKNSDDSGNAQAASLSNPGNGAPSSGGGGATAKTADTARRDAEFGSKLQSDKGVLVVETPGQCGKLAELLLSLQSFGYDFDLSPQAQPSPSTPKTQRLSLPPLPPGQTNSSCTGSTETSDPIHGVAFSWREGCGVYVPLSEPHLKSKWELIQSVLGCEKVEKVGHGVKNHMRLLRECEAVQAYGGIDIKCPVVDVRVAAWVRSPDALEVTDSNACQGMTGTLQKLLDACGFQGTVQLESSWIRGRDSCRKALGALKLFSEFLKPQLQLEGLLEPLMTVELPLMSVLAEMEHQGVPFDPRICNAQEKPLQRRLEQLEKQSFDMAGRTFNLDSPKDVSDILFCTLNLDPPANAKKMKGQAISTRAEVLQELGMEHQLPLLILEYRRLSKLLSGFSQQLKKWAVGEESRELPRLYGSFNQTATATGRLSMDEPNLQNIPKPVDFEALVTQTPPGHAPGDRPIQNYTCNIRAAFVASEGCVMLSADYAQLELRIMAHFSGDEGLCQILSEPDGDPFRMLAARWKNCDEDQVTASQRNHAKRLAYGLLYGMGPHALAQELGTEVNAAKELSITFQESLPGVERWLDEMKEFCRTNHYIQTLKGRRRYLPQINDSNWATRSHAERQAINSICQGSAADLVKIAMARLRQDLTSEVKLLLQIHDELLFEVRKESLSETITLIKSCMEDGVSLAIPTPVKIHVGPSWGQLQEWIDTS